MKTIPALMTALVLTLPLASLTTAHAQTDLGVDAVTKATTLNTIEGDVATLIDGLTPENAPAAAPVSWGGVGMVRVEWPHQVELATIRIYAGLAERYAMYAYAGGHFDDEGQRVDVIEPTYLREGLAPLDENIWFEIECDASQPIDNLGIIFSGTSEIYEIQFLGPTGTAVTPASLGAIKARLRR